MRLTVQRLVTTFSTMLCTRARLTRAFWLVVLMFTGPTAATPAQESQSLTPQIAVSSVADLRRPVYFDDLRALRAFFERVDVSGVATGVSRPPSAGVLTLASPLGRMSAEWEAPFVFVQAAIRHVPYRGSVRGARGTLESGAGNAVDQALLLRSLLEARGVRTRLVRGRLQWDDAARLAVGSRSPAAPRPDDPWPRWLEEASEHWWVQAQRDGEWVDLDASFADAAVGEAVGTALETHSVLPPALSTTVRVELLRGELPVAEVILPTGSIVGEALALSFVSQAASAVALWQAVEAEVGRQADWLGELARVLGWLPRPRGFRRDGNDDLSGSGMGAAVEVVEPVEPARLPVAPRRERRPSAFQRIFLDPAAGPWQARLEVPGRSLFAGPFERADLDSLLVRLTVNAPQAPAHVLEAPWGGGTDGRLVIVVAAGAVADARLAAQARPLFNSLNRLALVEQSARVDMRPPIDYYRAADELARVGRAEWRVFERAAPVALGWALLHGVDRVSAQSPTARVIRPGLRLTSVRWRPPDGSRAGSMEVLMSDPVTVGQIDASTSSASLRAANGLLQSAVFSQVLNRLTERAPETAFDVTLRAIGTGQELVTYSTADAFPASWPLTARAEAAEGLRAGYLILAPRLFGGGEPGWWNVDIADGETLGWVPGAQSARQGRVDLGLSGRLRDLDALLASLPSLHRALRWLAQLPGSGPTALASVPDAACASAVVAAEVMSTSVPATWPRPDVLSLCGPPG